MASTITFDGFESTKNPRPGPSGTIVDVTGWISAPTDWTDEKLLERAWNLKHGSRLGVGLCVANNPRRHFLLSNVTNDLAWVENELSVVIQTVDPSATGYWGGIDEPTGTGA